MSKKMTGGEAVVQSLIANEVKIISGLIGSSTPVSYTHLTLPTNREV